MSDDLKDIVVDWGNATQNTPALTTNDGTNPLVTLCTEGANLLGVETAQRIPQTSIETFTKNDEDK